jgi:uncharacterized protein (UPF0335 family)
MIRKSNRAASGVASITTSEAPHGATKTNDHLPGIVERIEKLEQDRQGVTADLRGVYTEAKSEGFNVKALRRIVRERQQDVTERAEMQATMDAYRAELGMAVQLVESGLSLREAERATGVSKSSIHRALAVPEVSRATDSGTPTAPQPGAEGDLTIPPHLRRERLSP